IILWVGSVKFRNLLLNKFAEGLLLRAVDINIIGTYTRLSRVDKFAPGNAAGGRFKVGRAGNDSRGFSAQLQCDRRQLFGSRFLNDFAHAGAAGKKDIVQVLIQQLLRSLVIALNDPQITRIEVSVNGLVEQFGCCRRQLRWFYNSAVAGSHRAEHRIERKLNRIVPGSDDQRNAIRLRVNKTARRKVKQRSTNLLGRTPPLDIFDQKINFLIQNQRRGGVGFKSRLFKIGLQRFKKNILILL